jgi:hypothetical protein
MRIVWWTLPALLGASLTSSLILPAPVTALASARAPSPSGSSSTIVSPYVDMGATGLYPSELRTIKAAGLHDFTAGFVVGGAGSSGCVPRWDDGTAVSHDSAATNFVADARAAGAEPIISFGGQGSAELASTCGSATALTRAYAGVARRFDVTRLDFDIEGHDLSQTSANNHRFRAIRRLQVAHPAWSFSLTVPVGQRGLPANVRTLLAEARAAHVRLPLLNIMTFDYGPKLDMAQAAARSAKRTLPQLQRYYPQADWSAIAVTTMIGRNDTSAEVFTPANATALTRWAVGHRVGRLAFWSLGRDAQCQQPETTAQDDCSGVSQRPAEFSRRFVRGS